MTNKEIKEECEKAYAQIKAAHEKLKELRGMCKHEETKEVNYSYYGDPSRARPTNVCIYCGEPEKLIH